MYTFLLILLILDSAVLIAAILLQSGKGTGLAASFGGASSSPDAFIGIRQAGNLLTKASWWAGGIFLFLSFVLQLMSAQSRMPKSVLEGNLAAPAPAAPSAPSRSAPAVPLSPAPTTPASKTPPK
jgi:preprotein translocase subunit SecG